MGEGFKFRLGAGDEEDGEAGAGELEGKFLADAIGGAGDDGPGLFRAKASELERG